MLDGAFWIARTGSPWRGLPESFGLWASVYRQFRRWALAGVWDVILEALNEAEEDLRLSRLRASNGGGRSARLRAAGRPRYDSDAIRQDMEDRGGVAIHPPDPAPVPPSLISSGCSRSGPLRTGLRTPSS